MLIWPFLFVWPIWVPVVAWLAYGSLRAPADAHAPESRQRAPGALWAVLAASLLVGLWAHLGGGLGERSNEAPWIDPPAWPMALLHALAALQLVIAVAALHRYRRAWPYAVPTVLAALAYTLIAWVGGMMSITNTWL
jgi:hypothetical protein